MGYPDNNNYQLILINLSWGFSFVWVEVSDA